MHHEDVAPRADKTLGELHAEWLGCLKCPLGEQRAAVGGQMVFGEGVRGGIMFIAGGPGENEQDQGRPFVGPSGRKVLRPLLIALGIDEYAYITNLVACRSCTQQYDNAGQPIFKHVKRGSPPVPMWRDEDPPQPYITACAPRLLEEIYLVDPVIIVAMGVAAVEALREKPVAITRDRGMVEEITIPGATFRALLTEKKRAWSRGITPEGTFSTPVERGKVRYLMVPTLHPAHVARNLSDKRPAPEGPFQCFAADVRLAAKIHERYLYETAGIKPTGSSDTLVEINEEE